MRKHALSLVVAGTLAIAAAYALAFVPGASTVGAWLMALGLATMIVSLMTLGAVRAGRSLGALRLPLLITFVAIAGSFIAALSLPAEGAGSAVVLGFPLRAAIVIYGVGLVPLVMLPVVYAMTFDEMTLSEDDLARVREVRARLDAGRSADAGAGDAAARRDTPKTATAAVAS